MTKEQLHTLRTAVLTDLRNPELRHFDIAVRHKCSTGYICKLAKQNGLIRTRGRKPKKATEVV